MPPPDASQNRGFRYPFYACEILSDEQIFIADIFFPSYQNSKDENDFPGFSKKVDHVAADECVGQFLKVKLTMPEVIALDNVPKYSLIEQLFTFLEDSNLNHVLAGYFSQVVVCLLNLKQSEMCELIYCQYLGKLMKHINSRSICEIILKIINIDPYKDIENKDLILDKRNKLIMELLSTAILNDLNQGDSEILDNISYIFCEIFNEYKTIFHGQELMNFILSGKRIKFLLERTTSFDKPIALCAINILLQLTTVIFKDFKKNVQKETQLEVTELIEEYVQQFDDLMEFIGIENPELMKLSNGQKIRALGMNKLKLLESLCNVLKSNDSAIIMKFVKEQNIRILAQLMTKYHWNNILHGIIQRICSILFKLGEKQDVQIPIKIILDEFLQLSKELTDGIYRKGFLGHLTLIAQDFEHLQTANNNEFRFSKPDEWVEFEDQYFSEAKRQIRNSLGTFGSKKNSVDFGASQFQLIDVQQLEHQTENTQDSNDKEQNSDSDSDSSNSDNQQLEET